MTNVDIEPVTVEIPTDSLCPPQNKEPTQQLPSADLVESIDNEGLQTPISVYISNPDDESLQGGSIPQRISESEQFEVVDGWSRVLAVKELEQSTVRCKLFPKPPFSQVYLKRSLEKFEEFEENNNTAEDYISTAYDFEGFGIYSSIKPSPSFPESRVRENKQELLKLADLVKERNPTTFLEVGSARGGSLYFWDRCLRTLSQIISIDNGMAVSYFNKRCNFYDCILENQSDFIIGDSHDPGVITQLSDRLSKHSVDFLFIDGDHSYEGVKEDFYTYREFVDDDGIIAIHDIRNDNFPGVQEFWNEVSEDYETSEIIKSDGRVGIGMINQTAY